MHDPTGFYLRFFGLFSVLALATILVMAPAAYAQTGHVLHAFTGGPSDGAFPQGLFAVDSSGPAASRLGES